MNKKSILVVDDDPSICSALKRILRNFVTNNNIELHTAYSASKAMDYIDKMNNEIRIIISDHRMPGGNGIDFLQTISDKYPDIITILLTGHAGVSDINRIVNAGVYAFIEKPWEKEKLLGIVEKGYELAVLKQRVREQEDLLKEDLVIASEFQKVFLNVTVPDTPYLDIDLAHRCANDFYFGGDYYDIFSISDYEYFFLLGDFAGHGLKASFFTAILKAIIFPEYIKNNKSISPADFLEWLNKRLFYVLHSTPDLFVAFSACFINTKTGKASLANAGQPPFIIKSGDKIEYVMDPQIAIGVVEEMLYLEKEVLLKNNDLLIMCTDGLFPDGGSGNDTDKKRFNRMILDNSDHKNISSIIINEVSKDLKTMRFDDDKTFLAIRIRQGIN